MLGGAGVLVAGRYLVAVLAWTGTVIIVRELTPNEWGRYSFVANLLGIVGLIADLRLSRIVIKDVMDAEHRAGEVVGSYVALRVVIGLVSYAVAMAWVLLGNYPRDVVLATAVMGLNLVILSAAFGIILLFEARIWLRDVSVANVAGQVAQLGLTVLVAGLSIASILWFAWATVLNAMVTLVWLVWAARHATRIRLRFERTRWGIWMREAAPLALGSALDTIYFRIDVVMLSMLDTYRAVGTYSVGYKFSDLLGAVPSAVVTPALTMMVIVWPGDLPAFRRTFRHALILLLVAAIGATVGLVVFAQPVVTTLYTQRYRGATDATRLLVLGQALHFFTLLCFTTLVGAGRNRLYPVAMLVGVVANVLLNLVLIPPYSFIGSGWATVITEVLVLAVLAWGVARIPGIRPFPYRPLAKCLVGGVVMGGVGLAAWQVAPWPVAGLVAGVAYLAVLHLGRVDGPGGLRTLAGDPRDDRVPAGSVQLS